MSKVAYLLLIVAVVYVSCDRVQHLPSQDSLHEVKRSGFRPYLERDGYDIRRYRREAGPEEIRAMDDIVLQADFPETRRKRDIEHPIFQIEDGEMLPIV